MLIRSTLAAAGLCIALLSTPALAMSVDQAKSAADDAIDTFQVCASVKIIAMGKTESSQFLVDNAIEQCDDYHQKALDTFWTYIRMQAGLPAGAHVMSDESYTAEMRKRTVALVVYFKTHDD